MSKEVGREEIMAFTPEAEFYPSVMMKRVVSALLLEGVKLVSKQTTPKSHQVVFSGKPLDDLVPTLEKHFGTLKVTRNVWGHIDAVLCREFRAVEVEGKVQVDVFSGYKGTEL